MQTWAGERAGILKARHPCWDAWYVTRFPYKGYTWHARPTGAPVATIHAESPEALSEAIEAQEAPCSR